MYPSAQSQEDGGHFHRFWSAEWGVCIISGLFIALFLWEIIRWLVFGYLSDFLPFLGRCGSGRFPCKSLYITWKKEHQRCQQELASGLTPEKTPRPNWQWHLCVCVCGVSVCVVCVYFYLFFFFWGGEDTFLENIVLNAQRRDFRWCWRPIIGQCYTNDIYRYKNPTDRCFYLELTSMGMRICIGRHWRFLWDQQNAVKHFFSLTFFSLSLLCMIFFLFLFLGKAPENFWPQVRTQVDTGNVQFPQSGDVCRLYIKNRKRNCNRMY